MPYKQDPWYLSKRIYSSIVAVIALIAGIFGFSVGEEMQEQIVAAVSATGAGIAALLALWSKIQETARAKDD